MQIGERSGSHYYFYQAHSKLLPNSYQIFPQGGQTHDLQNIFRGCVFIYICIYIYIYINIMGGKNDATTYPDKPVS